MRLGPHPLPTPISQIAALGTMSRGPTTVTGPILDPHAPASCLSDYDYQGLRWRFTCPSFSGPAEQIPLVQTY